MVIILLEKREKVLGRLWAGLVSGVWVLVLFVAVFGVVLNVPVVWGSGTIYIRADGSIDPPTAPISTVDNVTYVFTDNIYDVIVVEKNDAIIDGKGYTLQGSNGGLCLSSVSNVAVKSINIVSCGGWEGLDVSGSSNCTVSGNNLTGNYRGVHLLGSSYISLYGNNVTNNYDFGVYLDFSPNSVLRNNTMVGNRANFVVEGYFIQDVDESNTVDGKPIYYWVNQQNRHVPSDAGYVALVNSNNITVERLELKNSYEGILIVGTTDSLVANNSIIGNFFHGVSLLGSRYNNISENCITNNGAGVYLDGSCYNTIDGNNITNNGDGVYFTDWVGFCSPNTVSHNSITSNSGNGIKVTHTMTGCMSSSNIILGNNISGNGGDGILFQGSSYNGILENDITNNDGYGVNLAKYVFYDYSYYSTYNTILGNNITNNRGYAVNVGDDCDYNSINQNKMTGNSGGVNVGHFVSYTTISENNITNSYEGIVLSFQSFSGNTISGNTIKSNGYGIVLGKWLTTVTIFENTLASNGVGIWLGDTFDHKVWHNNFVNNTQQVVVSDEDAVEFWDNGYPDGGNYWSDYTGADLYRGPYQNETGTDDIGDVPFVINAKNIDHYPLINPWGSQLPVVNFTFSYPVINEIVTFDASSSYDRDGWVVSYRWDFGDGNVTTVTDPVVTHIYTAVGIYTVNLTLTDDSALSRSIAKSLTVKLYGSVITLDVYPTTLTAGSNVTINGTITPARVGVNVTISYRLSGGTWTTFATAQTDSNSNYTATSKTTYLGTYEIKASWMGDENTWDAESEIKTVSVQGYTIYIRADGSVDPPTAPIQSEGDFYTFTDNVYAPIVVQRSNVVIDGDGFTLQDAGYGYYSIGFGLYGIGNVTIQNTNIKGFGFGIWVDSSSNNTITGNNIANNGFFGIRLESSYYNNTISKNNIANNGWGGIALFGVASNNSISNNNITDNGWFGISAYSSYTTIARNNVANNYYWGILIESAHNTIFGNNIENNGDGVWLSGGSNNTVSRNKITNNTYPGVWLYYTSYNIISENDITNNLWGVELESSFNNRIYHNNLINNTLQVNGYSINVWDDGYPSGGNYWSDYAGVDLFVGRFQNETGSDGIGDTPYIIDTDNQDHYPLINPWIPGYPIAYFTHTPRFPLVSEIVTFNASDSYDYDGDIISYEWNFGDGNITIVAEPIIVHVYTAQGVYSVNLTVTDNEGFRRSITRSIAVGTDTTPPTTVHDYDDLWHTTDFTITLTATDDLRGVAETYYKINDGPTRTLSADGQPLITTESANNTLEYWSVDNAGNEELPHKILTGIKLDKTAPTGSITINNGDAYTTSTSVTLTLTASDATSGVYQMRFSNDGITWTDWEDYTTSKSWTLTPGDGTKTVYYQIKDNAGLISETYTDTIVLDTTIPNIQTPTREPADDIQPDQSVKVSVNVTDATSQVKNVTLYYTINDGETWTDLPMNHTASNLYEATIPPQQADTTVRFKIVAYDHAENTATLDGTEPYCTYQVIPEFPTAMILPLFIVLTLFAVIFRRKSKMRQTRFGG